ncbi:UNVERIFIED_CONTAM: hypothetical protein O8I53_11150 [Campylobacter lari]
MDKIIHIFDTYNKYLSERSSLDYDDLIIKVNQLFNLKPEIAKK